MTTPNHRRPTPRVAAQILAFLLILLPGLGQHLTRSVGEPWLACAWIGLSTIGMLLTLLLTS